MRFPKATSVKNVWACFESNSVILSIQTTFICINTLFLGETATNSNLIGAFRGEQPKTKIIHLM